MTNGAAILFRGGNKYDKDIAHARNTPANISRVIHQQKLDRDIQPAFAYSFDFSAITSPPQPINRRINAVIRSFKAVSMINKLPPLMMTIIYFCLNVN